MSNYLLSITVHSSTSITQYNFEGNFGAIWMVQGDRFVNGTLVRCGHGAYLKAGDQIMAGPETDAEWIQFELSQAKLAKQGTPDPLLLEKLSLTSEQVLLRLDQVDFPSGAVAYRHVHPGDGIRYLSQGELEIISDNHRETAIAGHTWFETANSPVRAVASKDHESTSFVRFMVLPIKYAGKSTIQILDAEDAVKPRLQTTHRHFDKIVQVDAG